MAAMLFPVLSFAQETAPAVKDFTLVQDSSPWLVSKNVSGLYLLPVNNISTAAASLDKTDGQLMDVHESANSLKAGVYTESYFKAGRMTFYGKLSYSYFTGGKMGGPVLMNPSYNFINFVESTDTTAGRKVKELYSLAGGINYRISDSWAMGGRAFYESGNYAKRKDPRFSNSWTDMDFTAGISYKPSDKVMLGLNGEFRKSVESIVAGIYGESAKNYYMLVNYGAYFGKREILEGSSGYIALSSTARPMVNHFYGGSFQADFLLCGNMRLFNELTVLHRTGYYGSKSSGDVRFCDASGNVFGYKGVLSILPSMKHPDRHDIMLDVSCSMLTNDENTYNITTRPGESSEVTYLGSQQALDQTVVTADLSYCGRLGLSEGLPTWEIRADAGCYYKTLTAESYPNYRDQDISQISATASATRNFSFGKGRLGAASAGKAPAAGKNWLSPSLSIGFLSGSGTKCDDGKKASATGEAFSGTTYLDRNYEYMTAARLSGAVSLRYTRVISEKLTLFVQASDSYTRLLTIPDRLSGSYRNIFTLTLGCNF